MKLFAFDILLVLAIAATTSNAAVATEDPSLLDPELWPLIDLSNINRYHGASKDPDLSDEASSIVSQIRSAVSRRGFFLANVNRSFDSTYTASRQAHALPVDVKLQYAGKGYTGPDVNRTELAYERNTTATVAAYDYTKTYNTFVNPDQLILPECLHGVVEELYDWQIELSKGLFRLFARALALPEHTFVQHVERNPHEELGTLRLLYYPKASTNSTSTRTNTSNRTVGIAAHTDFEAFSTIHQTSPGLQIRARNSTQWETVPPTDHVVVIIGDVLERWTNGYWPATPHRVLPSTSMETDRYSIIRFHAVAGDTVIAPLAPFVNEANSARYTATTMEEIMRVITTNLIEGKGAWDTENDRSSTANYEYAAPVITKATTATASTCPDEVDAAASTVED